MRYRLRSSDWHKFWSKVDAGDGRGCWEWKGFRDAKGYGRYGVKSLLRGRSMISEGAHRIAWQFGRCKSIPAGMHVLHSCDNPACVRPEHLRLGTHAENMRDMAIRGRANGGGLGGEAAGPAKLTWEQVRQIRALLETETNAAIAAVYGVTASTISYIRRGKTWRCAPQDTAASGERAPAADGLGLAGARDLPCRCGADKRSLAMMNYDGWFRVECHAGHGCDNFGPSGFRKDAVELWNGHIRSGKP